MPTRPIPNTRPPLRLFLSMLISPRRLIRLLLFLSAIVVLLELRKLLFDSKPHLITPSTIEFTRSHTPDPLQNDLHQGFLAPEDAEALCSAQRLGVYKPRERRRAVYDLLMINDELDWLEIRLSTLSQEVDYFVIVESIYAFTLRPKELTLKDNWERFKPWHHQMIYHQLEKPPVDARRTWDVEDYQRNAMLLQGIGSLEGDKTARRGDVLMVSDVDEIPRPATVAILRNCKVPKRVTIRSQFYYYGFQTRHVGEEWAHPQATIFSGDVRTTILPADLRNGEGDWNRLRSWWQKGEIWNAGWHCSTCFERIEEVLSKMSSFSHTSLNSEVYRDKKGIVERVREGRDLWDRKGEIFERLENNEDVPEVIKREGGRWAWLMDRSGIAGGFKDYIPDVKVG